MIDDITPSNAIINYPHIEVEFNTTAQLLVSMRRRIQFLIDNPN
jgi:hypothetical protein